MRNILILLLILLLASKCRYKNNDNLSLQLVKTRLQKTWVLKETIVDGIDLTSVLLNEELSFTGVKKNEILIRGPYSTVYSKYGFKNNKTTIFRIGQNAGELKITKLTNKELWMEGNSIIGGLGGGSTANIIKVKYNAK
jgi:hypothetical protein